MTFPMALCAAGPHDAMTLMLIYLVSVSINSMLVSQLKRFFMCKIFVFTSIQCLVLSLFLISMLKKSYKRFKHHP